MTKTYIRITQTESRLVVTMPFSRLAVSIARTIPGRWYVGGDVNTFPLTQRRAVWKMICECFPGASGVGPKGAFKVPTDELPLYLRAAESDQEPADQEAY